MKNYFNSEFDNPPLSQKIITYFNFAFLLLSQIVVQSLRKFFLPKRLLLTRDSKLIINNARESYGDQIEDYSMGIKHELDSNYYSTLSGFQQIYNVAALARIKSCFHKEVFSAPGRVIQIRGGYKLNFGSYNYLGFAGIDFTEKLIETVRQYGLGNDQYYDLLKDLEAKMSSFLDKEDTAIYSMGYDTNALGIPAIIGSNDLIISDKLNHASIVSGCKRSGAKLMVFRHKMDHLEEILTQIDFDSYNSVWVIVEGLYSMEGCYVDLQKLVQLKEVYPIKLYVDEAHSIGAVGATGRGICEYFGIPHQKIDILMGTFTKSFSSVGGYIAGGKNIISKVRQAFFAYPKISPLCVQQVFQAFENLTPQRINNLKLNSIYLRNSLQKLNLTVYGDIDSPVIPVVFYNIAKMKFIQDYLIKRNIITVVVGFPAVPLVSSRLRFCVSASHKISDLDYLIGCMKDLKKLIKIDFENVQ
ncbi:Serine palmitoyltransferase 2 [Spironucleus salmonicida]|uniref:serine C-palmitoyltransferase n=1 Tax=Spironucleus salmonicida TaxID=348837 RepID=V6LWU8_9EUKA|nr:Serine palmitoyltransferase 2 [Spironucleus salmonicida]|eukprot:EST45279.1 Serine palmitoyltransferase 2 [Spironucleus salmonicida]